MHVFVDTCTLVSLAERGRLTLLKDAMPSADLRWASSVKVETRRLFESKNLEGMSYLNSLFGYEFRPQPTTLQIAYTIRDMFGYSVSRQENLGEAETLAIIHCEVNDGKALFITDDRHVAGVAQSFGVSVHIVDIWDLVGLANGSGKMTRQECCDFYNSFPNIPGHVGSLKDFLAHQRIV